MKPANADEIVKQWTDVHGLDAAPPLETMLDGHRMAHAESGAAGGIVIDQDGNRLGDEPDRAAPEPAGAGVRLTTRVGAINSIRARSSRGRCALPV